eukprot:jgi/Mesen1/210/ME1139581C07544
MASDSAECEIEKWCIEQKIVCQTSTSDTSDVHSWTIESIKPEECQTVVKAGPVRFVLNWDKKYSQEACSGGFTLWLVEETVNDAVDEWFSSLMEYASEEGVSISALLSKGLRMWRRVSEKLHSMSDEQEHASPGEALGVAEGCKVCEEDGSASDQQRSSHQPLAREAMDPKTFAPKEVDAKRRRGQGDEDSSVVIGDIDDSRTRRKKELPNFMAGSGPSSKATGKQESIAISNEPTRKKGKGKENLTNVRAAPSPEAHVALSRQLRDLQQTSAELRVEVSLLSDKDLYLWNVSLDGFPPESPLFSDLLRTPDKKVILRMTFSGAFPFEPPFVRVLRPRFKPHTGHVSNGGALCLEILTLDGWTPATSIESLLVAIRAAMVEGKGRLDLKSTSDYNERRAIAG